MQDLDITRNMAKVLKIFLEDPGQPRYGFEIMRRTGLASGSLYPMLARLEEAGWLTRGKENIDPHVEGRPPRLHYTITGAAVTAARVAFRRTQRPIPAPGTRPRLAETTRQHRMTGYLWAALGILAVVFMTAFRGMASDELRDRLDHLPHTILRLAARRLTPAQRTTIYHDEWAPELTYILRGAEGRPITRLIVGTRYALGILVSAQRIARHLHRDLEKTPSDSLRPPVEGPSSQRLASLLTRAEETQLREARRMGDYPHVEEGTGRRYRLRDLTADKSGRDHLAFEWHAVRLPEGRRWVYSKENLDRMYTEDRIVFRKKTGMPVGKRYLDEYAVAPLQDV